MSSESAAVELEDIEHAYEEGGHQHIVLHDLDLTVAAGEAIAVIGRSGAGKSTLLNLVGGLAQPSAGRVRIAGRDLTGMRERDRTILRRRHIGFVYQFFNLIHTLNVEDNISLPLELDGGVDTDARERVKHLLDEVGLISRAQAFPDRLSGGEQQRVAVVRALAHQPSLVLADEPTGNLDEETGANVLKLLVRLARQGGQSLVLVTHSRETAAVADRILRLQDGHLVPA